MLGSGYDMVHESLSYVRVQLTLGMSLNKACKRGYNRHLNKWYLDCDIDILDSCHTLCLGGLPRKYGFEHIIRRVVLYLGVAVVRVTHLNAGIPTEKVQWVASCTTPLPTTQPSTIWLGPLQFIVDRPCRTEQRIRVKQRK